MRREPSSPTSSSASSTPRLSPPPGAARRDADHRGRARRGSGAARWHPAGASRDELAPRDQVTAAILDRMDADGADHVLLDLRAARPGALSERVRRLPRSRARPRGRARPGRARRPLPDRWRASGPRRAARRCPGSTRSASARARDFTAPTAWRPTRSPSASCSGLAPRPPRRPSRLAAATVAPARLALRAADRGDARGDVAARRARGATPRRSRRLLDDPYPLARLIARAALERRESRGTHRAERPPAPRSHLRRRPRRDRRRRRGPARDLALVALLGTLCFGWIVLRRATSHGRIRRG